jgi:hypothetical protein
LFIAAIYFKNRVHKVWDNTRDIIVAEQDKNMIRTNILQALITAPPAVQ